MDPRQLFPWLVALFLVLAAVSGLRTRRWRGAPLTWLWIAACFGAVWLWLMRAS